MLLIGDNFDASLDLAWEQYSEESSNSNRESEISEEEHDDLLEQVIQEYYDGIDLDDHPF